jgi:hypothetical protein
MAVEREPKGRGAGEELLGDVEAFDGTEILAARVGQAGADRVGAEGAGRLPGDPAERLGEVHRGADRPADGEERLRLAEPRLEVLHQARAVEGDRGVAGHRGEECHVFGREHARRLLERGQNADHLAPQEDRRLEDRAVAVQPDDGGIPPVRVHPHVRPGLGPPRRHHAAGPAVRDLPARGRRHGAIEAVGGAQHQLVTVDEEERCAADAEQLADALTDPGQEALGVEVLQDLGEGARPRIHPGLPPSVPLGSRAPSRRPGVGGVWAPPRRASAPLPPPAIRIIPCSGA